MKRWKSAVEREPFATYAMVRPYEHYLVEGRDHQARTVLKQ